MINKFALALALAAAPFAASAGELSYTYVEAGAARVNIFGFDEGDGFLVRGSVAVGENFYIHGGHGSVEADDFSANFDADFSESQLGLGFRHGVNDLTDVFAELGYVRQELEVIGVSNVAKGGRASVGVRSELTSSFEGWLKASYSAGNRDEDYRLQRDFTGTAGAQFKFNKNWGLVGEIETGQYTTKYLLGVRASF